MESAEDGSRAVADETRFAFGRNWQRFIRLLNEERITEAETSLREMLGVKDLRGKSFVDAGSGSGLFSLAAVRLGAARVHSFDFDSRSVACTRELKRRFLPENSDWTIEQGSVLDQQYLSCLGRFDVVYSWGVLHHTGDMWQALENILLLVAPQGMLFISIYNEQGFYSRMWKSVKKTYNRVAILRPLIIGGVGLAFAVRRVVADLFLRRKRKLRGMSFVTDLVDWVGGYPFEVAKPDQITSFFCARAFEVVKLKTVGGRMGCNEFVFVGHAEPLQK
jgi:2-polyprenyl-6-hydroxyphenyl methylase/3-demethylubiquinone-9 3-methyltransferase